MKLVPVVTLDKQSNNNKKQNRKKKGKTEHKIWGLTLLSVDWVMQ